MKGYKVFNPDWTCMGKQYSCPGIFKQTGELKLCKNGIHFCKDLSDCFNYYDFSSDNKVAEIEAIGEILVDESRRKCCTSKIKIIRELSWYEVLDLVNTGKGNTGKGNTGKGNTGFKNTGNRNTGDYNAGDYNTGDYNTGSYNTGDLNSGNSNTGSYNTGNCNTGSYNTGFGNSGDCNTGNSNTGNRNTGDYNAGDYNTGDYNTGSYNTGDFNTGDYNTGDFNFGDFDSGNGNFGCFNTEENKIKFFNKQSDWTYKDWVESKARKILKKIEPKLKWTPDYNMTKEEKEEHPEYKTTKGFLRYREKEELNSLRQKWWEDALSKEEKESVLNLPNFDASIFKEITGIDV